MVEEKLLQNDVHMKLGCVYCHNGDDKTMNKDDAHKGRKTRPSDWLDLCGQCHSEIADKYKKSLHFAYLGQGQKNVFLERLSEKEQKIFNKKVFEKSCRSCHASCGDCHVRSPIVGGVFMGLIKGHKFVKRDEAKTCALCHGGRVYPEFSGEYGGMADVHYQKGFLCMDCHKIEEVHGDGNIYSSRKDMKTKITCIQCHKEGGEKTEKAKDAHSVHKGKASCYACHSGGEYRNCYDCHVGKGSTSKPGLILGRNPRNLQELTTLRLIPTIKNSFKSVGILMEHFDKLPNYWDTIPHNTKKRTDRTRNCDTCHVEKKYFLKKEDLIKNGSKANEKLIFDFKK